jgi:hypothetical protein
MSRIRSIKPTFWTDGNIVSMSAFARLFYIGMWNFTLCDHGHVSDDAMALKLQILPMDDVDPNRLLQEILSTGRVERIRSASDRTYLSIKRFTDHQKIDPRWRTRCPACAEKDSLEPAETPVSLGELTETPEDSPQLPLGRDGMGRDGKKDLSSKQDEFDQWYRLYPKKEAKGAAQKAFIKARKTASLEELVSGLRRYLQATKGTDRQFIHLPATWLNQQRWMDEVAGQGTTGDIDPDAILGKDYWTPPAPPAGLSIEDERAWKAERRAEHRIEREQTARKKLEAQHG